MLRDFLQEKIIAEDLASIFVSRSWDALRGKSIYISGASGMIASYLTMFLIFCNETKQTGIEIYAGVRSAEKAELRFGRYTQKNYFHLVQDDVILPLTIGKKIDYIVHAASPASPQYYGCNPVETMLPNVVGTYRLLEHAKRYGAESVLFFSSGAVYGEVRSDKIYETDYGAFDFMAPGGVYGESKRCGEALGSAYWREYRVPFKSVRIHHVYGPTLDLDRDHRAFSEFVKNILNDQDIVLMSDGSQKRAFCYLTDAILAILQVLLHGKNGESYNLANESQFVSILELAETLITLYPEKHLKVIRKVRREEGYLSLAQTNSVVCDASKIRELGCEFTVSVRDGFKRTIEYFMQAKKERRA